MPRFRLIAIDIDGTLLDSKTNLRDDVAKAIRRAIDEKIFVVLATGRMVSASRKYLEELNIDLPTIALNGSFVGWVSNKKEPIYHKPISPKTAMNIVSSSWDIDVTSVFICCDNAHVRNIKYFTGKSLESWVANITALEHKEKINGLAPSTILVAGEKETIVGYENEIDKDEFEDIDTYFFPSIRYFPMHYLEIRARGTSKGKGLSMVAKWLGIEKKSVLAIGDFLNDIPMKESAGLFSAPKSAHPRVLEIADYVSPLSNDEGAVAEILETLVFKGRK